VQAIQISKAFGARDVLDGVSFRLDPGERLAVVGRNGEGKTTLLRILAGLAPPDAGRVSLPAAPAWRCTTSARRSGTGLTLGPPSPGPRRRPAGRGRAGRARRADGRRRGPRVLAAYEAAQARLERAGGYAWRAWMERVLRGLGISEQHLPRPLSGFSGGELTRASLARALVSQPDVLLLDEPTNHLDLGRSEWLERAIGDLGAAVVLVSHDRWFLESVATGVLELDRGGAKLWPMGYSAFRRERALAIDRQGAEAISRRPNRAPWSGSSSASLRRRARAGAASRQKRLDRTERVQGAAPQRHLAFGFPGRSAAAAS
jgi:ATP-binding cassette subfamily F protein 3